MRQKYFFPLSVQFQNIVITIILITLALFFRFYKLGEWSFDIDEVATQIEVRSFFDHQPLPEAVEVQSAYHPDLEKSQFYRLPQLIFVAHFVHRLNNRFFGNDEWGSRVLMAVMGSLSVGLAFLLGRSLLGFSGSLILAFLILLSPELVFYSQYSRFYSQAFLFIEIVFLLGGHVAVNRSVTAALVLVPTSLVMILSHSLGCFIWGILLCGLLVDFFFSGQYDPNQSNIKTKLNLFLSKIPYKILFILCTWSIVLLMIFLFHIVPLTKSWNDEAMSWNISPICSVVTFASIFGRSYFILCIPAWIFVMFNRRNIGWGYWMFCTFACGSAIFLLPLKIVFSSMYGHLFAFPFFVILALFIAHIGQLLAQSNKRYGWCCGIVWCCFMVSLNIFALNNYYKDGNRCDWRSACQYIKQHWQQDDQLFCTSPRIDIVDAYILKNGVPTMLRSKDMHKHLQQIFNEIRENNGKSNHARFWILLSREHYFSLDKKTRNWIGKHCQYEGSFGNFRYDSPKYLEVFVCSPQSVVQPPDAAITADESLRLIKCYPCGTNKKGNREPFDRAISTEQLANRQNF